MLLACLEGLVSFLGGRSGGPAAFGLDQLDAIFALVVSNANEKRVALACDEVLVDSHTILCEDGVPPLAVLPALMRD